MHQNPNNADVRTTTVCIDSYQNNVLAGRFYNPSLEHGERFENLMQFLLKLEHMLAQLDLPQAFSATRAFTQAPNTQQPQPTAPALLECELCTFALRIIFRQNASWQGSVTWLEKGTEQNFRSVLELVVLIDSALQTLVS